MDPSFIIPRLITELLLPGIFELPEIKNFYTSFSQIKPSASSCIHELTLVIERLRENVKPRITITCSDEVEKNQIKASIKEAAKSTAFILQLLTGREIKDVSVIDENPEKYESIIYQYTIALRKEENEILLEISIPGRFFNILIPSLDASCINDNISDLLIPFFKKPDLLYPSIAMLLSKLDSIELSSMLDLLKRNNRLSDYQLVLLISGFPEYSLKIKNALSKKSQEILREELKKYKGRVSKEDIACGIYSVEENISHVYKKEKNHIADRLKSLSILIKKITDYELYMRKSWPEWISEMEQKNMLYKTILKCSDRILQDAFPGYNEEKYPFFTKNFSPARISELFSADISRPPRSVPEARIIIIKKYRKLITETLRYNHEDFAYIAAAVIKNSDFEIIVRNTGWYILSTALKQCSRKLADRITGNINFPASVLIKGVISGTINPDIIHDEIQVNRAGNECVKVILELYLDGIIELEI
ncbi:MAG TPA: hypothetical protein PK293_06445 [Spirochaetota bacterium]|nr:hypothetical protein [Spirochaetota bacterium]